MDEANLYKPESNWTDRERQDQEDAIFFTVIRQQGATAEQISFRLKNGVRHSLPWTEISEIYYVPEEGITLFFRLGRVEIQGRNLEKLQELLEERKVIQIREFSDNSEMYFDKEALCIQRIIYDSANLIE